MATPSALRRAAHVATSCAKATSSPNHCRKALALKDAQLNLGHIEPAAVFRGVVDFQLGGQSFGLGRG